MKKLALAFLILFSASQGYTATKTFKALMCGSTDGTKLATGRYDIQSSEANIQGKSAKVIAALKAAASKRSLEECRESSGHPATCKFITCVNFTDTIPVATRSSSGGSRGGSYSSGGSSSDSSEPSSSSTTTQEDHGGGSTYCVGDGKYHSGPCQYCVGDGKYHVGSCSYSVGDGQYRSGTSTYCVGDGQYHSGTCEYCVGDGKYHVGSCSYSVGSGTYAGSGDD